MKKNAHLLPTVENAHLIPDWKKGICMVCGLPVNDKWGKSGRTGKPEEYDMVNAAVLGEYIPLEGHRRCINNVDRYVVWQNRARVAELDFQMRVQDKRK